MELHFVAVGVKIFIVIVMQLTEVGDYEAQNFKLK